jgi:hypothetical protein
VFRGLSELDLLKLLEQLHEQGPAPVLSSTSGAPEEVRRGTSFQTSSVTDTGNTIRLDRTPPPGFEPMLILHQESISILEMMPFPVYLLQETLDTKAWLLQ